MGTATNEVTFATYPVTTMGACSSRASDAKLRASRTPLPAVMYRIGGV